MKYSLIIPCYNESKNLPILLNKCNKILSNPEIELIIVNNGSTDETEIILNNLKKKFINFKIVKIEKNKGYGNGIILGIKESNGKIIAWTHADLQTDPNDVMKGFEFFEKFGPNIFVKGLRFGRPISDRIFTLGMSFFETMLLMTPMRDINAQPTIISKEFFHSLENPPFDFSLDLFTYYNAKIKGLKLFRFPVFFGDRIHGQSNWNINWSSKLKFIIRTIDYSLKLRKKIK